MKFFICEMHVCDFGVVLVYNRMSNLFYLLTVRNNFEEGSKQCHLRLMSAFCVEFAHSLYSVFHRQQGANGVQVNGQLQTGLGVSMVVCLSPVMS